MHLKFERHLHANSVPPAQSRRPHGTSGLPLNAAWFPTWHGSQLPIARDPLVITAEYGTDRKNSALRWGIHPCCSGFQVQGSAKSPAGMALFRSPRLRYFNIITDFQLLCKYFLDFSFYFIFPLRYNYSFIFSGTIFTWSPRGRE